MENNEEILSALDDFCRLPSGTGTVSAVLEKYLQRVAANGITVFPWCKVKPLLRMKLDVVLKEFQEKHPVDIQTPCPNVDNIPFNEMHQRLLFALDQFTGTPFTIQRLCELVINPMKHYKKTDKFMRGIEKNLAVVTTVDSFGNRIVNESKSLSNGLDMAEPERAETPDLFSSGTSTNADHSASPFVPSVPMNSPATSSSCSSWQNRGLTASDSPNLCQNWSGDHCSNPCMSECRGDSSSESAATATWSGYDKEDIADDGPSPSKRSCSLVDGKPWAGGETACKVQQSVVTAVAPLLGQLLNSNEDVSDNSSKEKVDNVENTDPVSSSSQDSQIDAACELDPAGSVDSEGSLKSQQNPEGAEDNISAHLPSEVDCSQPIVEADDVKGSVNAVDTVDGEAGLFSADASCSEALCVSSSVVSSVNGDPLISSCGSAAAFSGSSTSNEADFVNTEAPDVDCKHSTDDASSEPGSELSRAADRSVTDSVHVPMETD